MGKPATMPTSKNGKRRSVTPDTGYTSPILPMPASKAPISLAMQPFINSVLQSWASINMAILPGALNV